jgi:hypothetical protein
MLSATLHTSMIKSREPKNLKHTRSRPQNASTMHRSQMLAGQPDVMSGMARRGWSERDHPTSTKGSLFHSRITGAKLSRATPDKGKSPRARSTPWCFTTACGLTTSPALLHVDSKMMSNTARLMTRWREEYSKHFIRPTRSYCAPPFQSRPGVCYRHRAAR